MADAELSTLTGALAPVQADERIHALDIVRGFALVGIFLMNVEWFTRPTALIGSGVDASQTGWDYVASWMIYTFIQGKFWTLFSLLFGMGFAVMFGRAESAGRAGRGFVTPYVRRLVALFVFGAAHFILLWTGDILHDYAVTAVFLLLIVTRSWKAWLAVMVALIAIGAVLNRFDGDVESIEMTAAFMVIVAMFMYFIHRGPIARYWKGGVLLFSLVFALNLGVLGITTAYKSFAPEPTAQQLLEKKKEQVEQEKNFAERMKARNDTIAEETRVSSGTSYSESVRFRADTFLDEVPSTASLSVFALPMFMIGFWFVRSGVIADWRRHLPLFRKLAAWTLTLGLAMTLTSVWLTPSYVPTPVREPRVWLSDALFRWAMLPLSIGYFAAVMSLLGTRLGQAVLSPLRFAGQMALTNYIGATIVGTLYCSGYGLGHWGQMGRAGQVLFVFVVFAVQLLLSFLWLRYFRYGPLEWLWRAITYWTLPPMRRTAG